MPRALECMTTLQHYFRSKRTAAAETSAIFLLPHIKNAAWDVYTKRMAVLGTFSASSNIFSSHTDDTQGTPRTAQRPCSYILYYDAPHMPTGELCSSALPNSVRDVHMGPDAPTFIFTGKAAGMHSVILWDSGATKSLINADFAQRHNLHTTAYSEPVKLANGHTVMLNGVAKIPITIQQYRATVSFHVMQLADGIDLILGNDWSKGNSVLADYGREGSEPSLLNAKASLAASFPIDRLLLILMLLIFHLVLNQHSRLSVCSRQRLV